MDWFHRQLDFWKDPVLVWRFQKLFGVERIRVETNGKSTDDYVAVDYDDWLMRNGGYDPRAENADDSPASAAFLRKRKLSSSGYSSGASASCDHVKKRKKKCLSCASVKKTKMKTSDQIVDPPQERSESEVADKTKRTRTPSANDNVLYYRLNSAFWYWFFFLGTQLGAENYYSIFFSIWFWNIDGAVGRRVMMVWCLVMYIGRKFNCKVQILALKYDFFQVRE